VDEQELFDKVVEQEIDCSDDVQQRNTRREGHTYIQRAHDLRVLEGQPTIRTHVVLVKNFLSQSQILTLRAIQLNETQQESERYLGEVQ